MKKLKKENKKIIVIVGPTSVGKSELALRIAKKINGEIISTDSRQVYKELDIGTGKVPKDKKSKKGEYLYQGVPHHLISIVSIKRDFTVFEFQKLALKKIKEIWQKGKIPILCGGTGFYLQAVIDNLKFPVIKPNKKLRQKLEKLSNKELIEIIQKEDPEGLKNIDLKNRRRLIRRVEIIKSLGQVPKIQKKPLPAKIIFVGLIKPKEELKILIKKRIKKWLKAGLLKEVKKLIKMKLPQDKYRELGLVYKWAFLLYKKNITQKEFLEKLTKDLMKYAKRQMTWFKKDSRINWFSDKKEAEEFILNSLLSIS